MPKNRITKWGTASFVGSSLLSSALGLLRSLLLPVILAPSQLGGWNFSNLLFSYGSNLHLGLVHALSKVLPGKIAIGDAKSVATTKSIVLTISLSISLFGSLFFLLATTWHRSFISRYSIPIAIGLVFTTLYAFFFATIRASSNTRALSVGTILQGSISAVLVVGFGFLFHDRLLGCLVGVLIAYFCAIIYWAKIDLPKISFGINTSEVRALFKIGLPLIAVSAMDLLITSIDRFFLSSRGDPAALGFYAFALMAISILAIAPGAWANANFPKIISSIVLSRFEGDRRKLLDFPVLSTSIFAALSISTLILCGRVLLKTFLPKYNASASLIAILACGSYLYLLSLHFGSVLISYGKEHKILIIQISTVIISVAANIIFLHYEYGIRGIAISTSIALSFYGICYMISGYYAASNKLLQSIFKSIPHLLVMFFLVALGLVLRAFN